MVKVFLRLALLALGVVLGPLAAVAHPLPGSTVTLAQKAGSVAVTLTIPVPELIAARPTLAALGDVPKGVSLPAPQQQDLAAYLREHIALTPADQPELDLQLISVQVQNAQNADVDHYDLLIVELSAPLQADQRLFPATLIYDAVLHEVRNHRATVWLAQPGKAALPLGKIIRFDAALGRVPPLELSNIP
jgi:hypothetical protein